MTCINPIKLNNPKSRDKFGVYHTKMEVPCGKCMPCRVNRTEQWRQRLLDEFRTHGEVGMFITLTYNDQSRPEFDTLVKTDLQKFLNRMRNSILRKEGKKIKYFGVGEYGESSGLPHYHIIIFGYSFTDLYYTHTENRPFKKPKRCFTSHWLDSLWTYGFTDVGTVTHDSCGYVAGYIQKKLSGPAADEKYGYLRIAPFQMISKGLGKAYCMSMADQFSKDDGRYIKGKKISLPKYYRDKLWSAGYIESKPESVSLKTSVDLIKDYYSEMNMGFYEAYTLWLASNNQKQINMQKQMDIKNKSTKL